MSITQGFAMMDINMSDDDAKKIFDDHDYRTNIKVAMVKQNHTKCIAYLDQEIMFSFRKPEDKKMTFDMDTCFPSIIGMLHKQQRMILELSQQIAALQEIVLNTTSAINSHHIGHSSNNQNVEPPPSAPPKQYDSNPYVSVPSFDQYQNPYTNNNQYSAATTRQ